MAFVVLHGHHSQHRALLQLQDRGESTTTLTQSPPERILGGRGLPGFTARNLQVEGMGVTPMWTRLKETEDFEARGSREQIK